MKKFLSLVLTLALTMSLVVLPARAEVTSVTLNKASVTLDRGENETLTATVNKTAEEATTVTWTSSDTNVATVDTSGKVTAVAKGTATITAKSTDNPEKKAECTVTVSYKLLAEDVTTITFNGRSYAKDKTVYYATDEGTDLTDGTKWGVNGGITVTSATKNSNKVTLALSKDSSTLSVDVTVAEVNSVTIERNGSDEARVGLAIKYDATNDNSTSANAKYRWSVKQSETEVFYTTDKQLVWTPTTAGTYSITCKVSEGSKELATSATSEIEIAADHYTISPSGTGTIQLTQGGTNSAVIGDPIMTNTSNSTTESATTFKDITVKSGAEYISLNKSTKTVQGVKTGTAVLTVTVTYKGKDYSCDYTVSVKALDYTLDAVDNGSTNYFDTYDLLSYAQTALDRVYTGSAAWTASSISSFGTASSGTLTTANWSTYDYVTYVAPTSVGKYTFTMAVNTYLNSNSSTTGTKQIKFTIPVNPIETTFEDQNAGSATSYTVTKPSGYSTFWVISKNPSTAPTDFTNYSGAGVTSYALGSSDFKNGECVLYIVAKDSSNNKLYCGSITVYQQYIEYSGVSGEETAFEHEDFTEFLEDIADGKGVSSSRYPEFAYVKFSPLPNAKTQGTLYYDGTAIKASDEIADLDKVTFVPATTTSTSSVNKTVSLTFQLYAYTYSGSTLSSKASNYVTGTVVIDVISGNIKYSVPVNGNVVFDASDFEDFYTDTYKNGTLSYVTFDKLSGNSLTDGILYALYSTLGVGTTAKTSDKFYYDSSKITDYDLDDVTFKASAYAKVGDKVYLPFNAYGTTTKNSKTVSSTPVKGCVVITLTAARTMNFTDVTTADWFYNNVKNAYTMGLIEGKTTTAFKPNDNMTYAEAVTLAARMNELYYTGKVTLENSKTGNWYSSYESYAISKGIISTYLGTKANTNISRRDYVEIFYNALPVSAYTVKNSITKIPDLANDSTNAKIYTFYKAGILTGYANTPGKTTGSFGPNDNIKRSEVATILIRMMDASTRMYFTL